MSENEKKTHIEFDATEDMPDHVMPTVMTVVANDAQETCLQCVVYLSTETPERVQDHIIEVLDMFSGNFTQTEFCGKVMLQMWSDQVPDESCAVIKQVIEGTLNQMQSFVDSRGLVSADGNPLKLLYTFVNKFPD
ncbi:MAG: hypothetical protein AB8C95_00010 [Phycisphaeraceae bacterium]